MVKNDIFWKIELKNSMKCIGASLKNAIMVWDVLEKPKKNTVLERGPRKVNIVI